jgi:hypothetical protein
MKKSVSPKPTVRLNIELIKSSWNSSNPFGKTNIGMIDVAQIGAVDNQKTSA